MKNIIQKLTAPLLLIIFNFSSMTHADTISMTQLLQNDKALQTDTPYLKNYRVVMPGVLYRGGNSGGGAIALKETGLKALCENGFSEAVYMYPNGFKSGTNTTCSNGQTVEYTTFGGGLKDPKMVYNFMKRLHKIITTKKGPLYVHCWNGWHASGEMAAMALMQFCGWNGSQAAQYWQSNIGDKGSYPSILKRIQLFNTFDDLTISPDVQKSICPAE